MRLFAAANPVRVMASGSIDVNHKDETYDGKVIFFYTSNEDISSTWILLVDCMPIILVIFFSIFIDLIQMPEVF